MEAGSGSFFTAAIGIGLDPSVPEMVPQVLESPHASSKRLVAFRKYLACRHMSVGWGPLVDPTLAYRSSRSRSLSKGTKNP